MGEGVACVATRCVIDPNGVLNSINSYSADRKHWLACLFVEKGFRNKFVSLDSEEQGILVLEGEMKNS